VLTAFQTAAKEKMFSPWCADPALAADLFPDETGIEAREEKGEKSHQGFASKNPAHYQGIAWSKSTTALGLRAEGWEKCNGSRCTGKERDSETGLDYFGARYYSNGLGRFLSPDWSAKAEPVPYAKLDNPQSLNLYAYALNNPLRNVDPDGHDSEEQKQKKIAAAATAQNGSHAYDIKNTNISNMQIFKPGSDKCNEFVADTVKSADGTRPVVEGTGKIPTAAQFADPNVKITGLSAPEPLANAKPGDVIAQDHGPNPKTGNEEGHVGIVVSLPHDGQPGQTASANANEGGKVTVNDWGFRNPNANPNNGERHGASSPAPVVRRPLGDPQ
jgi:RHS repeat-associated protein